MSVYKLPQNLSLQSLQIKLVLEYVRGVTEKNLDTLEKCLHKNFRRTIYPKSIGEPTQNKEEFLKLNATLYLVPDIEVYSTHCYSTPN
jgi:hypothetical protein